MSSKIRSKAKSVSNDGRLLEQHAAHLLRLYPGSTLSPDTELAGKKIDILLETTAPLLPKFTVAVECKDWARPLSREQCAAILADYYPLLDQRLVDQILLVTRNGIVSTAKKLFDGRRQQHLTFGELADRLFNPLPLVMNMKRQYELSDLNTLYVKQYAFCPNLEFTSNNYEAVYNDFLDFAASSRRRSLKETLATWKQDGGEDSERYARMYSKVDYEQCLLQRVINDRGDLMQFADEWISSNHPYPLAILGSYGTGKSSFAKHLAFNLADKYLADQTSRIPFLIELKEFGSHQDIRGLITHELVNRHGVSNGSFDLFQSLNAAGRFVVILDGFDEMKQGMTADALLFNFNQLAQLSTGNSRVLLCGRPTLFESSAEQQKVLTGKFGQGLSFNAKYIQVEIAPFELNQSREFLEKTAMIARSSERKQILSFAKEILRLEREVRELPSWRIANSTLKETVSILSRPVHLPMLAAVLPRRRLTINTLRRTSLYSEFIDAIIEREMLKRRIEFTSLYDAQARRKFARAVSLEMAKRGESRAIRYSDLPASIFEPFRQAQTPLDAVRRDLVSACFLERKGSEILYFPHKSFWEYLVSEEVARHIREVTNPTTDSLGFRVTEEMLAFLSDLLTDEDWLRLAQNCRANSKILADWVRKRTESKTAIPTTILHEWSGLMHETHEGFQRQVAYYLEAFIPDNIASTEESIRVGKALLRLEDDVTAVHAYRALKVLGAAPDFDVLEQLLGRRRVTSWCLHNWFDWSKYEIRVRNYLAVQIVVALKQIAESKGRVTGRGDR